jgi:hypothetical protein
LEENSLNPYFEENGFSSKMMIKNLGSSLVYTIFLALLLLLLPLLRFLSLYSKWLEGINNWTGEKLIWNGIFYFILSQFPTIIISSGINLYELDFQAKFKAVKIASSVFSIILTSASLASLLIIWIVI